MLKTATSLVYNLPIYLIFGVLLFELAWRGVRLGPAQFLRFHGVTLVAWAVGAGVLYLRLVTKSIEASGHMTWLPLLTMQAYLHSLPSWFVWFCAGFTIFCLLLKLTVFGVVSGLSGMAIGMVLAGALLAAHRKTSGTGTQLG